jgi:hypothetical protein
MVKAGMSGLLQERMLQVAKRAGVIGHRRVVDSTGIADSVVTQDTVTLIRSAARRCLARVGELNPATGAALRDRLVRSDYDEAGKPQIVWSSPVARAELVNDLFTDATTIAEVCGGIADDELGAHVELLAVVAAQDLEVVDEGDEPQVRVRQGVAADRVISVVDPDARHGHRSRRDRYDGYKLHLSTDADSDLITAIEATTATTHDAAVLGHLLEADPLAVAEVIADTHYGSGSTRQSLADDGVELVAPAQPPSSPKGLFSKDDFAVDLAAATVTCPAGQVVAIPTHRERRRIQIRFPTQVCAACPLRSRCTKRAKGRVVELHPHEQLLAHARAVRWTPEFRDRYRQRARVERKIAQLKARQTKIPWRGLTKATAWARLRAGALNLDRIGRLGLIG